MKCEVNSNSAHNVLISKEISYKSYKEICSREPKKVNMGFKNDKYFKVENNSFIEYPKSCSQENECVHGQETILSYDWEVLSKFFSNHNIEPNWLKCYFTYRGWYDEELGGWTGCTDKV